MRQSCFSLYIHIPFCSSFCDYCDFYSVIAEKKCDSVLDKFVKQVIEDIRCQFEYFNVKEIVTAYIGGGTPSVLGAKRFLMLLEALKSFSCFAPAEFTTEANPESTDEEFLSACIEGGINRISLGVQSFHEPSRKAVNRIGQADMLEKCLTMVSHLFPDAFSADLIAGFPYQSKKNILEDIKRLLDYKPAHVSFYSLSVEDGTPLEENLKSKQLSVPLCEEADLMWLAGKNALEKAGYEHYEVSSFALPGRQCLHNLRYWHMDSWLGAGPAASGTLIDEETGTAKRFTYKSDIEGYINTGRTKKPERTDYLKLTTFEELDKKSLIKESMLMGFRSRGGIDREKFRRRFGMGIEDCIPQTLKRWNNDNKKIMFFLNNFLTEAFAEIETLQIM
ncbi:MAG: radical SAM family heme chaperone HemW [Treponema sp.]|nr:radical SAM family heme chaperone HemW [Treponema sp.]